MKPSVSLRIGFAAALLAAIVAGVFFLPVRQLVERFLEWINGSGSWGLVLFALSYIVACLAFLPGSPLTLAGGFMFGLTRGIVAASIGSTLGAAATFAVSRWFGRKWLEQKLPIHPRFSAIDRAIGDQGFKIVLLFRLCLLFPYAMTSYMFGLTRISPGKYILGTMLGRLPGIVVWSYLGSNAKSLADLATGKIEAGIGEQILLWIGLAAMAVVAVMLTMIARRALSEAVTPAGDDKGTF
jgi:uncharacterized membrane protein YdjX (TVP38/TMEM64 family)